MGFFGFLDGVTVGRLDVRRTVSKHVDVKQVFGVIVYLLMVGLGSVGGGYLGYFVGSELVVVGDIGGFSFVSIVGGVIAVLWVFIVLIIVFRGFGERGRPEVASKLMHIVSVESVGWGVLLSEMVYLLMWLFLPAVGLGLGFGFGFGSYHFLVLVPVLVVLFSLSSVAVGYPIGLGLKYFLTRFRFLVKYKTPLIVLVFGIYLGFLFMGWVDDVAFALFEVVQNTPLVWYGDFVLFGMSGVEVEFWRAMAVVLFSFLAFPLGVLVTAMIGSRYWLSDPVSIIEEKDLSGLERELESVLEPGVFTRFFGKKIDTLIHNVLIQTVRNPIKALYSFFPVLFVPMLMSFPEYLPIASLLLVAWSVGSLFSLNLLGDQGVVLPSLLISGVKGRELVLAHIIPTLLIAIPLGIGLVVLTGVSVGTDYIDVLVLAIATPVLMVFGSLMAVWLGTVFPRFESIKISSSTRVMLPSKMAYIGYTFYLVLFVFSGALIYSVEFREVFSFLVSWILPFGLSIGVKPLYLTSIVVFALMVLLPFLVSKKAINKIDGYSLS
ncbi:hypothetical protein [Methanonatronarchaeum sp. AMET-Sl]|uniref:hypothetical protein n=1 Tax=Methanonatronarchaeum sp. AMET-Sl TaxID=3037654 RepID=UPI00244E3210|nr:hypothetical protein [Methanonatronarchaeum sp. AMET-Sl]WGI18048.1 hypothetical protein QEN48_03340 [Methanonatronarchaeum sp. AMET-Sl]